MRLRVNVPRTHATGFTLLEVVIAIAILAVVLSSLYGAYASSVEATEQIENARDVEQASRLALMQVADDFKSVYHQEFEGDLESSPYRFIGGDIDSEGDASKVVEFASWRAIMLGYTYDQIGYCFVMTENDPLGNGRQFSITPGHPYNFCRVEDPVYDAMYQEAQSITDAARIEELVKQMNFYSLEHVWYIGMPETLRCAVWQKWLKNYDGIIEC